MPPEKCAYALARYSRSPDSIRESIEWVRTHDSQKFLESFYFQYGHASIADLGHTVLCFEGISELAATEIEDEPLWDGQAKSSRYQDFSRSGFVTPPELDAADAAALPRRRRSAARRLYARCNELAFACLAERLPVPDDMKPDAYQRNLAARAFDVARYLLFWGVPTNVGQVTSIRTLEKQIRRLQAPPNTPNCGILGEEIAAGLRRGARLPLGPRRRRPNRWPRRWRATPNRTRTPPASRRDLSLWAQQNLPRAAAGDAAARGSAAARPRRRRYRGHAALSGHGPPLPRALRDGRAAGATRRRAEVIDVALAIAHPPRRNPGRLPRRPVRLRHGDRYRRLPRPASPPPLPEIPPGVFRRARLRHAAR